jgi:hypothetical protein
MVVDVLFGCMVYVTSGVRSCSAANLFLHYLLILETSGYVITLQHKNKSLVCSSLIGLNSSEPCRKLFVNCRKLVLPVFECDYEWVCNQLIINPIIQTRTRLISDIHVTILWRDLIKNGITWHDWSMTIREYNSLQKVSNFIFYHGK